MRRSAVTSSVNPDPQEVESEVCRVLDAHGLKPSLGDVFFIYRSTPAVVDPAQGVVCGWHANLQCHGQSMVVSYVAGPAGSNGACIGKAQCNTLSAGATAMVNITAHEFMESITDPDIDRGAWIDEKGAEIADKCAFDSGYCVGLTGGVFLLPSQYSNRTQTCVIE